MIPGKILYFHHKDYTEKFHFCIEKDEDISQKILVLANILTLLSDYLPLFPGNPQDLLSFSSGCQINSS